MGIDSRYVGNPTGIYGRPRSARAVKLEKKGLTEADIESGKVRPNIYGLETAKRGIQG